MKLLRSLFSARPGSTRQNFPAPAPDHPLWVIGDIHGRADLLPKLLNRIEEQTKKQGLVTPHVIYVGDFVDRGDQSAEVLQMVSSKVDSQPNCRALLGNHEDMMLEFLDNPGSAGRRWLRYGGLQTLASFGVGGVNETSQEGPLTEAAEKLRAALPIGMENWLRALPRRWTSGNVHVVHAGADPNTPMGLQNLETFTWGHPDFETTLRKDGQWVVHGHTVTDTPGSDGQGRIATDTGAYYTGTLTAALITPDGDVSLAQT